MKKITKLIFALVVVFGGLFTANTFSLNAAEPEVQIDEYKSNLPKYAAGEAMVHVEGIQTTMLSEANPTWVAKDTATLALPEYDTWMLPDTDYAYFHYEVDYDDSSTEYGFGTTINYQELMADATTKGKVPTLISVYYVCPSC